MATKSGMANKKSPKASAMRRRDGAGHLDPSYAADLLARSRATAQADSQPFVSAPFTEDDLAEQLAEKAIASAIAGEDELTEALAEFVTEEEGGPFLLSAAGREMAEGTDESNPKDATVEPFPTV